MEILDRVKTNSNICKVFLAFEGIANASVIQGWQPFYNSLFTGAVFHQTYASLSSIDFSEESAESFAGTIYTQKISFRFPTMDSKRPERIALLKKVKFIKISFNNGLDLVIGRNDFNQNSRPKITVKTNENLCEVEIECKSIFPAAFTPSAIELANYLFFINSNNELVEKSVIPSGLKFDVNNNMELVQSLAQDSPFQFYIDNNGKLIYNT